MSAYYNRTDDPAKALEYADQALALDPRSDRAWFQKGRASERQGKLDDVVTALTRAISTNPRASSYYYVPRRGCTAGWAGRTTARRRWKPQASRA